MFHDSSPDCFLDFSKLSTMTQLLSHLTHQRDLHEEVVHTRVQLPTIPWEVTDVHSMLLATASGKNQYHGLLWLLGFRFLVDAGKLWRRDNMRWPCWSCDSWLAECILKQEWIFLCALNVWLGFLCVSTKRLHTSALHFAQKGKKRKKKKKKTVSLCRPAEVRKHNLQFLQTSELLIREISNLGERFRGCRQRSAPAAASFIARPHLALPAGWTFCNGPRLERRTDTVISPGTLSRERSNHKTNK